MMTQREIVENLKDTVEQVRDLWNAYDRLIGELNELVYDPMFEIERNLDDLIADLSLSSKP